MAIPLLDLKQQYATIRDEVLRVTEDVYASQMFILGPRTEAFEKDLAAYCGARHAVGLSSGTDALMIALMVLGVRPGDEVIVPAYSFFATAGVVERLGATPVFIDVEPVGLNLDPNLLEGRITPRTRAIIPVHLYGQTADMEQINSIASRHGIRVVEDAAQAIGAEYDGKRAGTLGDIACFSFFPSKNLGAFGDAGAVTTDDDALAQLLLDYRVHGMRPKYFHRHVGGNFRIDALQAAILHVKLRYLDEWTAGRQRNAEIYSSLFAEIETEVIPPVVLPRRRHVFNQYVIRFPGGREVRDRVMTALRAAEIGCEIYYPVALPDQDCFRNVPSAGQPYPVSREAAETSLAIPIFPELTEAQISQVVGTIREAVSSAK